MSAPDPRRSGVVRAAGAILVAFGIIAVIGNAVAAAAFGHGGAVFEWTNAARGTVAVTLLVVLVAFVVGTAVGACAAMGRGLWDALLARAMEVVGAVPSLAAVVVVRALVPGPSALVVGLVLAVIRGLATAKIVRAETLQLMGTEFFLAARAMGSTRRRLFRKHVFPHLVGSALAGSAFAASSVVALEAALSFLGFTGQDATWGALLAHGAAARTPGVALFAVLGVLCIVVSLHVLGDAFEDRHRVARHFG